MKRKFKIVFVCTGNICRSPMATGLLKEKLPKRLRSKVRIESAGTMGIEASPASEEAVHVMEENGIDIRDHRSRGVNNHILENADVIFAMADNHRRYLESEFPNLRDNIFLLRTFDRDHRKQEPLSVPDPIGGTVETYRKCRDMIEHEIDRILPRLTQLIEDSVNEK